MNRIIRIILIIVTLVCSAGIISSCSSSKKITGSKIKEMSANRLMREINANSFDFESLQAKVGIKVETEDNAFNLKGQLKMKKDSILWASITLPLGLEVARIKVTADSIFFINKSNKSYLAEQSESFNYLQNINADINTIQSVFTGNIFLINKKSDNNVFIKDNKYNLLSEENITFINNKYKKNFTINKNIITDPTLSRITKYEIINNEDSDDRLTIDYSDFIEIKGKYLPSIIKINISTEEKMYITITYSNISTNNNTQYNFSIPKKYERIKK